MVVEATVEPAVESGAAGVDIAAVPAKVASDAAAVDCGGAAGAGGGGGGGKGACAAQDESGPGR